MKLSRPLRFIAFVGVAIILGSVLNVAVTKKSYSENYPAVVCPPTLPGLSSQISLSSRQTPVSASAKQKHRNLACKGIAPAS